MITISTDAILFPDTSRKWTYEDVQDWGEDVYCDILNGELYLNPSPTFYHQQVLGNLGFLIHQFVKQNKLGKMVMAPQDTRLNKFNLLQPDILFISKDNKEINIEKTVVGSPDLVVEIISPSSIRRDYHQKKDIYEEFKVKEYWIVDPGNQAVEVFGLKENKYELIAFAESPDKIVFSEVLQGFEVTLAEIFEKQ